MAGFLCARDCSGQLDRVRSLPMMLCCDEKTETGELPNDRDVNQTLRLFHAAGGLLSMRVYRNKSTDGTQQVSFGRYGRRY